MKANLCDLFNLPVNTTSTQHIIVAVEHLFHAINENDDDNKKNPYYEALYTSLVDQGMTLMNQPSIEQIVQQQEKENRGKKGGITYEIPLDDGENKLQKASTYARIIHKLKKLCQTQDIKVLPSHILKLQNRLNMYEEIFPGIDRLINELYKILHVNNLNQIMPRIKELLN